MKKYFIISGLNLSDNNRGTAALGYGAFTFLKNRGLVSNNQELLQIKYTKRIWKKMDVREDIVINGEKWILNTVYIFSLYRRLFFLLNWVIPFTKIWHIMKNVELVAAINGGDGFSDIYNTQLFRTRLTETLLAMKMQIPIIQLPQTLGPFKEKSNYNLAEKILRYSSRIFVRDTKFVEELSKMGLDYEITKDLSAYMVPEPWDIEIKTNSIGLNVSGLAYSNSYRSLSGQFSAYPALINAIIIFFQSKGHTVYLIPHSYNYNSPEETNDDMVACKEAYERLIDKSNVIFVNKNLTSPQVKYLISKMSFFCGTRMHANFAAIYTNVPVFGLAYSYKFEGAFSSNGLDGNKQTALINNIDEDDIKPLLCKIQRYYSEVFS